MLTTDQQFAFLFRAPHTHIHISKNISMWEGVIFINPLNLGNPTFFLKLLTVTRALILLFLQTSLDADFFSYWLTSDNSILNNYDVIKNWAIIISALVHFPVVGLKRKQFIALNSFHWVSPCSDCRMSQQNMRKQHSPVLNLVTFANQCWQSNAA